MLQNFGGIVPYISEEEINGVEFCVGDTLLANIRPYLKKAWLATHNGACSSDVLALCPSDITPAFLNNIIEQDRFIEYVMSGVKGSKMPRGDKAHILAYETAVPSEIEQEKINSFMQLLNQRIEKVQTEVELLKKYKRGVVRTLLSPNHCKIKDVKWTTARIGEIGTFIKGAPLSKADISADGTPFILYGELYTTYNEVITQVVRKTRASVDKQYYSQIGDVIIPTSGETPEEISTASCVMLPDIILAGDLNIYRCPQVDGRIMSYILNHIVNDRIARVAQGKSIVHVQAAEISKIEITYPDPIAQKKLIETFGAITDRIDQCIRELELLQYQRKALLQQLFI